MNEDQAFIGAVECAVRKTGDLAFADFPASINVHRDIDSFIPQFFGEHIETFQFDWIEREGVFRCRFGKHPVEMMKPDQVVAGCGKMFHHPVHVSIGHKVKTFRNVNSIETNWNTGTFFKLKLSIDAG